MKKFRLSPLQSVALSFLGVILLGGFLLYLPFSQQAGQEPVSLLNAMFTATSATCVTGLVVVQTFTQWSMFGQIVIISLIQIGGLSFIAIIMFIGILSGKKLTLNNRLTVQAAFNQNKLRGMAKTVLRAIRVAVLFEGVAALILCMHFIKLGFPVGTSIWYGIFHSISAFCNAGFDILGSESLVPYNTDIIINFVIMTLIVTGGLGVTVWGDVGDMLTRKFSRKAMKRQRFSIHTKLALITTAVVLTLGATYFFIAEYNNPETIGTLSTGNKMLASLFQSVTLRTAGFASIPQDGLKESSKFIASILMLIGASPGGTGGGIKTVTFAVIFVSVIAVMRGREEIDIMNRRIPFQTLQKALAIVFVMITLLFVAITVLSVAEYDNPFKHTFFDIMFEVASALATVGNSVGITPHLSPISKFTLMLCMYIGRLGPMTLAFALARNLKKNVNTIKLPVEDVLVG